MLVLSRKIGEQIHIGDNIILEIRRISGNRVTLALSAPQDVRILRGELVEAKTESRDKEITFVLEEPLAIQEEVSDSEPEPKIFKMPTQKRVALPRTSQPYTNFNPAPI